MWARTRLGAIVVVVGLLGSACALLGAPDPVGVGLDTSGSMAVGVNTVLGGDHSGDVTVTADGVTLDCAGFTVSNPGGVGIDLTARSGVTVKNCRVDDADVGIEIDGGSGNYLFRNTVTSTTTFAILVNNTTSNELVFNVANGGTGWGIGLGPAANDNLIKYNSARNFVNGDPFAGGIGYAELQSSGNEYVGNFAADNSQVGFGTQQSTSEFVGNLAMRNGSWGFIMFEDGPTVNVFENNQAIENGSTGFSLGPNDRAVANVSRGNGGAGFGASFVDGVEMLFNTSESNDGAGFVLFATDGAHLAYNQALDHCDGFQITGTVNSILEHNTASAGACDFGVGFILSAVFDSDTSQYVGSNNNVLRHNDASSHINAGFSISDNCLAPCVGGGMDANQFDGNVAVFNTGDGFHIGDGDANVVSDSVSWGNDGSGIAVNLDATNTLVEQNTAVLSGGAGIWVVNATTTVDQNTSCNNEWVDAYDGSTGATWTNNNFCTPLLQEPPP